MARFENKDKSTIGLSPDDIKFRGERKMDNVVIRLIDYDGSNLEERIIDNIEDVIPYQKKESVTWINIDGLHDEKIIKAISKGFGLELMVLGEVMDVSSRPRVHEHDNCISLSIKMLRNSLENTGQITVEHLSIILTKSVIITFQEETGDVFEPVRERIRKKRKRIRNSGTDYLAFALLDIVIDNYIYIIGSLGERIESLEETLLDEPRKSVIDEIYTYKRELNFLRKNISPAKEMILNLGKMETDFIEESSYIHFKELMDNISQANESSATYREILSDQLNIYHTTISSKLNDIMKFLTIFSVIFIPLTFIAGIYGTNFDFVPELHYEYSYFIMWGIMLSLSAGMVYYFRRKKWM